MLQGRGDLLWGTAATGQFIPDELEECPDGILLGRSESSEPASEGLPTVGLAILGWGLQVEKHEAEDVPIVLHGRKQVGRQVELKPGGTQQGKVIMMMAEEFSGDFLPMPSPEALGEFLAFPVAAPDDGFVTRMGNARECFFNLLPDMVGNVPGHAGTRSAFPCGPRFLHGSICP
jgi:hypothetical protein